MRKRILAFVLACMMTCMYTISVCATEVAGSESVEAVEVSEEATEAVDGEAAAEEAAGTEIVIPTGNMVDVDVIDLSLHAEETGDFTPVYTYANPFKGKDTSKGVILEFYAKPTWEVNALATIFAFNGTGDYDGKLYFTPCSYLGFNCGNFGGYYDANLYNYMIVTDYIKDGALMRIELLPDGFAVYADDTLCYDQTILDDPLAGAGDYTASSDFAPVLEWLAGAEVLYFGYGSWWNAAGSNEANIDLSKVNFRLMDGTVVMDQLKVDKDLVESLGGTVSSEAETTQETESISIEAVDVEIFDISSVEYQGESLLVPMVILVGVVAVLAVLIVLVVTKKRTYSEI